MPLNTANVITGAATLFTAPANTALPGDTVAVGVDWPAPWVNAGATEQGVSLMNGTNTQDITIEEQSTPVAVLVATSNIRIQVGLSEDTIANMKLAYGRGTITTQASAVGVIGKSTLALSDTLDRLAIGFEGVNSFGLFRRVYIPVVVSVADVTTAYRRAANNRSYTAEFRAICPPSQIIIVDKTANAG